MSKTTTSNKLDRLPPHSPEAETGVLGCLLLAPNEGLARCITQLPPHTHPFYDLRHQKLYATMAAMFDRNEPIDLITLQHRLSDDQQLEQVGGVAYLMELPNAVPSAANLEYYASIVREKHLLRRMVQTCTGCVASIYEWEGDVDELLDRVEHDVLEISQNRLRPETRSMVQLVDATTQHVEHLARGVGLISGVRTRFGYLDKMLGGLQRGELTVIAARPSMGKTALALNIAANVALLEKIPVGVFSMEMSAESLCLRLMCSEARVDSSKLRTGFPEKEDLPRLAAVAPKIAKACIHIDDTPALSILDLRARARRMTAQYGCKLFVIDYLQLMHSTSARAQNREQEIADISGGLKGLAKELNVPVVALSQLNREVDRNKTRKPQLADLRESGAIEQDADVVGMLYRKMTGDLTVDNPEAVEFPVNLLIAKQRNGPTGDVELFFQKAYTLFHDAYGNRGKEMQPPAGISGTRMI